MEKRTNNKKTSRKREEKKTTYVIGNVSFSGFSWLTKEENKKLEKSLADTLKGVKI